MCMTLKFQQFETEFIDASEEDKESIGDNEEDKENSQDSFNDEVEEDEESESSYAYFDEIEKIRRNQKETELRIKSIERMRRVACKDY